MSGKRLLFELLIFYFMTFTTTTSILFILIAVIIRICLRSNYLIPRNTLPKHLLHQPVHIQQDLFTSKIGRFNLFLDPNTTTIEHVLTLYSLIHSIFFIVIFFIVIFFIVIFFIVIFFIVIG